MDTESGGGGASKDEQSSKEEKMETSDGKEVTVTEKTESAEKKEPEPNFQQLFNPARVLPQQVRENIHRVHMSFLMVIQSANVHLAAGYLLVMCTMWCNRLPSHPRTMVGGF